MATADGTFHSWRVVEQSIDPDRLASGRIVVEVDLASVDTGSRRRDEHLRTADFFEVERWPTARVVVDGFEPIAPVEGEPPTWRARFTIDLHGVTRVLEASVSRTGDDPAVFEGDLVLDRTEFGVGAEPSRWNPMSIEAEVPVRFRYVMEEAS
jgi:polyisoprenoid-binding protein YceI